MPKTDIVMYAEDDGSVPFLNWFASLPDKAQDKVYVRLERLRELGHELRRPEADYLRDDIYEVRTKHQSVNYRVLYFFYGRTLVVLSHGFAKQQARVPDRDLYTAIQRRKRFVTSPNRHTYKE